MSHLKKIHFAIVLVLLFGFSKMPNWVVYENNNCKISFPSTPRHDSTTIESAVGPLTLYTHMLELSENSGDSNLVYGFIETEYPKEVTANMDSTGLKNFFKGAINGAVTNVKGKLLSEKNIMFKEVPGKEILVDFSDGLAIITMRFYLQGFRLFAVQTIAFTGKERNASSSKFFNSFEIK